MRALIYWPFEALSTSVGASPDEVKILFSFLLSYPLAAVLKRLPDEQPAYKNIFIISSSIFYLVGLFDLWDGLATLCLSAGCSYCIARFLRQSVYMPWIGFIFSMTHMSVSHIRRQVIAEPSKIDVTGAQMVLVMKLSAFCWNVADGQLPKNLLSDSQKERALQDVPSLLDFAAYVLFFPGLFAGPAFDYADYRCWVDTSMFEFPAEMDGSKRPPTRNRRKIPRSGTPALYRAACGLIWISLYMALSPRFSPRMLVAESFLQYSLLRRVWTLSLVTVVARMKYYGVWALAEGSCILAGLGYNGVDMKTGRVSWSRLQNVDPWKVETAQNTRELLAGWNMNTNNWLRNYVYLRVTPRGRKPGFRASFITFATSALWHGFYPGYYLSFLLANLVQAAAKKFRSYVRPFFFNAASGERLPAKTYYDIGSFLITQLTFSFIVVPFLLLSLTDSLTAWSRVYYYGFIWTVMALLFFASPGKRILKSHLEQRVKRKAPIVERNASADGSSGKEPILGISKALDIDVSEAVKELRAEVEARRRDKN